MMADTSKKENGVAVDIRVVLLTIVGSMAAAFWCGVAFVPPRGGIESIFSVAYPIRRRLAIGSASSFDHSPSGQHLSVDIKGIEADFLDSEERLTAAMVQTAEEAGLTMLSYYCHKLMPEGISCIGVLLEGRISFSTWPEEGVINLDLFTIESSPLLPVVPLIERIFGIGENTETKWGHTLRGFHAEKMKQSLNNFGELSLWIMSPMDVTTKNMIYGNATKYQRVDIWDMSEVRFLHNECLPLLAFVDVY
jgi:S-adenosylmethionine/arginine decarboxylase-like enzyme